jgi:hypothetical protein
MSIANFLKLGILACLILQIGLSINHRSRRQAILQQQASDPTRIYTDPPNCLLTVVRSQKSLRAPCGLRELLPAPADGNNAKSADLPKNQFTLVSHDGYLSKEFSYQALEAGCLQLDPSPANRALWWSPTLAASLMLGGLGYLRTHHRRAQESLEDTRDTAVDTAVGGQLVGERYLLTEMVGSGATSEVWKAIDQHSEQTVAFKWLLQEVSAQAELVTRFQREAAICQQLRHPNLIQVLDQGQNLGRFWLVQPWLDAQSLDHLSLPLEPHRVRAILLDICSGLAAAHAQGILHRDLKPANILIDRDGKAIIIDFGLARSQSYPTITNAEAILGTPAYMAPEQLKGDKSRCESDCYSLGCMAFELLTGQTPFPTEDLMKLLTSHMSRPAPAPSSVVTKLSQEWDFLVKNLMQKDPDSRYSVAAATEKLRNISST